MKQHSFAEAMKIELVYEGGKDDDPVDPGGRTNQGIIQREYSAYRIRNGLPARDVFLMEPNERDEIYDLQYGKKIQFDALPPGVDLVMLDGAINSGVTQSIKWAQRALGLSANGVLGLVTMQRIQDHPDHDVLIHNILQRRREFLQALKTFSHFGKGWMARVNNLEKVGQAWAMGSVGPPVIYIPDAHKKANVIDAKPMPMTSIGDSLSAGGTVTTTLTGVQNALQPLQGTPLVDSVLKYVLIASVVLTALGFAWAWYSRRERDKLNSALDLVATSDQGSADNADVPPEVMKEYKDPNAKGSETGNFAPKETVTV